MAKPHCTTQRSLLKKAEGIVVCSTIPLFTHPFSLVPSSSCWSVALIQHWKTTMGSMRVHWQWMLAIPTWSPGTDWSLYTSKWKRKMKTRKRPTSPSLMIPFTWKKSPVPLHFLENAPKSISTEKPSREKEKPVSVIVIELVSGSILCKFHLLLFSCRFSNKNLHLVLPWSSIRRIYMYIHIHTYIDVQNTEQEFCFLYPGVRSFLTWIKMLTRSYSALDQVFSIRTSMTTSTAVSPSEPFDYLFATCHI